MVLVLFVGLVVPNVTLCPYITCGIVYVIHFMQYQQSNHMPDILLHLYFYENYRFKSYLCFHKETGSLRQ